MITRRRFFSLLAAPAIVKVASIMPISAPKLIVPIVHALPLTDPDAWFLLTDNMGSWVRLHKYAAYNETPQAEGLMFKTTKRIITSVKFNNDIRAVFGSEGS